MLFFFIQKDYNDYQVSVNFLYTLANTASKYEDFTFRVKML